MSAKDQGGEMDFVPIEASSLSVTDEARRYALQRCAEYKAAIDDYLQAKSSIVWGIALEERLTERRRAVAAALGGTDADWADWRWHLRNVIRDTDTLAKVLPLSEEERQQIEQVSARYRWGISPYYASLMDPDDPACPVRRQAVPSLLEVEDPSVIAEQETVKTNSPAPGVTLLYPDRLIINVTNACSMFCRHCLRRRDIGFKNMIYARRDISQALDYVRQNPEIRDVLLTGGDALMLSDDYLDWILTQLDAIEHVEVKRLGSRTPVVLPMRVTDALCAMLARHGTVYLMTQFNHSREITVAAREAVDRLVQHGVLVADQTVLLRGVNADRNVMKKLMQDLLRIKVRPYYIFHCKKLPGVKHFRAHIEDGLDIVEFLRGYTSGLAVPTYIVTAPDGRGKTPVQPQYILNTNAKGKVLLRTWGGFVMTYDNEREEPSPSEPKS